MSDTLLDVLSGTVLDVLSGSLSDNGSTCVIRLHSQSRARLLARSIKVSQVPPALGSLGYPMQQARLSMLNLRLGYATTV
jgi:hypothetical protein